LTLLRASAREMPRTVLDWDVVFPAALRTVRTKVFSPTQANGRGGPLYISAELPAMVAPSTVRTAEVMGLPPCTLCWYQRIFMFPLALLLPIGIVLRDPRVVWYCLPLVAIGLGIAVYHNGIDYGVIPERLAPCTQGVSCATRQIEWLGFVSLASGKTAFYIDNVKLSLAKD